MEYLDRVTLKHRIAGRPVETDVVLSLAIEVKVRSLQLSAKALSC